jgi:hypothetical protein
MLKLMVCIIVTVRTIIITQVKHEAFINEIVDWFRRLHINILYSCPHYQIFFNRQKWKQQIFIAMIASLKLHVEDELVFDNIAVTALSTDQIFRNPLGLGDSLCKNTLIHSYFL